MVTIVKKQWRRIVSIVLAVAMVVNMTPIGALHVYAADGGTYTVTVKNVEDELINNATVTVQLVSGMGNPSEAEVTNNNDGTYTFTVSDAYAAKIDAVCEGYEDNYITADVDATPGDGSLEIVMNHSSVAVTFEASEYGTFTDVSTNVVDGKVAYGEDVTFKFTLNDGITDIIPTISDGTNELTPDADGMYTLSEVKADVIISVMDIVDTTAPTLTVDEPDNTDYAASREITFTVADNSGDVTTYASKDELTDVEIIKTQEICESPYVATENGTYYIYAVDNFGNFSSDSVEILKIDTEKPEVTNITATTEEATTDDVTIEVEAEDTESGVAKVVYSTTEETDDEVIKALTDEAALGEGKYTFDVSAEDGEANTNTYYVWAIDNAGNVSAPASVQVNIDKSSPVFTVKASDGTNNYATGTWTNADEIVITVESEEETAKFIYNTTNDVETATEYNDPIKVTEEKEGYEETYYFWAIDELGNISSEPTEFVVKIDRTPAVVESIQSDRTGWTDRDVTISGTVSDAGVGVEKVVYSKNGKLSNAKEATLNGNNYEFTVSLSFGDMFNGSYSVWAIDKLGNVSKVSTVSVKIDRVAPSAGQPKANPSSWTNTEVVVTGTATDRDSGVAKVVYNNTNDYANATEATLSGGEYTFTVPNTTEFNGRYYVWAVDTIGNVSDRATVNVYIDTTVPKVDSATANPNDYTNKNVVVSGTVSDVDSTANVNSGVVKVVYNSSDDFENALEATLSGKNYEFIVPNTAEYNGSYFVWAIDAAGNVSTVLTADVKIDITAPSVDTITTSVAGDAIDFTQVSVWTNQNVTVSGTVSDNKSNIANSDIAKVVYSTTEETDDEVIKALSNEAEYADGTYSFIVESDKEFNGSYYVWTVDKAGNVSEPKTIKIKIETTKPSITDIFHDTTSIKAEAGADNYYFYNNAMDVSVTCEDTHEDDTLISGVAKLEYSVNQEDWVTAEEITGKYSLTDLNKHYTVWARVTDYAGNISEEVNTKVIILDGEKPVDGSSTAEDTTKPVIQISHSGTKNNGVYSSDVTLDLSIMDPILVNGAMVDYNDEANAPVDGVLSGLKTVYYEINAADIGASDASDTLLESGSKVVYGDGDFVHKWTHSINISSSEYNSNNVVVTVWAEDNAGNKSEVAEANLKIDTTAPTVEVSFDNNSVQNEKYFQADRTATIKVTERNFDPANTIWEINGSEYKVDVAGWTETKGTSANGDDTTWTTKVSFTEEEDYIFKLTTVKDLAANEATDIKYNGQATNEFTIDKTNPTINVSYDNNSAENGKYFAAYRTATVTINERNFDEKLVEEKITASLNGAGIAVPSVTWGGSGDNHTATISYAADGDYTFDIAVTDLSGRENEGVNYGSSAAPKEFTIDTTIVKPIISGVANGVAYKDAVMPVITFNDVNYQSHTISLLRTRLGERNVDVTSELLGSAIITEQGFSLTAANFEEIRENDGIYTLTVTATDRAGNEESERVTFTVNRFGSVYVFSDYLADLVANGGKYVPSVTEDLIVTEYNPDKLVEGSLIIEITRDGKPIDADFAVSPDINEYVTVGESGWFQYRYTLDKENFAADGIYKIFISSQDETGNYPEISNFEDMAILFRVDSTAPEITSVVGLEKAIVNAQELEVKYTLFDAIALKSVKLYVDGELVEELTDFEDMNNYEGKFILEESNARQSVRLVVEDMAGNITDTSAEGFESAYIFNPEVTVSTNIFVRWFANKPLFFGSIGAIGAAGAAAWYFLIGKKKKEDEDE